jgi:hypothetical protein
MSVGTGRQTEHFNSVLEITVSFLGKHEWESDIAHQPFICSVLAVFVFQLYIFLLARSKPTRRKAEYTITLKSLAIITLRKSIKCTCK